MITINMKVRHASNTEDSTLIAKKEEEVYLFGGKELKPGKKCISCCTYAYFVTATLLAITWFVLISIEFIGKQPLIMILT